IRNALSILEREPSIKVVVVPTFPANPFFADRATLASFQKTILGLGKKIVYVSAAPQFSQPPTGCRPRTLSLLGTNLTQVAPAEACREPRTLLVADLQRQRALFAELAKGDSRVSVYDALPPFCDAQYCYQADKAGLLFWMYAHVNDRGSLAILGNFLPW